MDEAIVIETDRVARQHIVTITIERVGTDKAFLLFCPDQNIPIMESRQMQLGQ